jgi:DNA polymerase III subunit delta
MWAGEPALRILTMVARHFRIVSMLQDDALETLPRAARAKAVGVSPFFLRDYENDARRFGTRELAQIRDQLLLTDVALKSSRTSNQILMEKLVHQICHRRASGRR